MDPRSALRWQAVTEARTTFSLRLIGIAAVVVAAWVLLWPVLSVIRSMVAFALYVVVAVVAYQIGKVVGRASRDDS